MLENQKQDKVYIIDGFRGVAILMVLLYHYFSRWLLPDNNIDFYPYGNELDFFPLGRLGVQFFFMISGFVIFMTLDKTVSIRLFFINRFLRLFPTMLFVSLITFIVFKLLGSGFIFYDVNTNIFNFFTSITFISPEVYKLFNISSNYLNGSYWSLWPEIQFYLYAGLIYFTFHKKAFVFFIYSSFIFILLNYLFNRENIPPVYSTILLPISLWLKKWINGPFNLFIYLPHFVSGVIWYYLYSERLILKQYLLNITLLILLFFQVYSGVSWQGQLLIAAYNFLFLLLQLSPRVLNFFSLGFIQKVGIGSYALYLLHEQIGVALINKLPKNMPIIIYLLIIFLMSYSMIMLSFLYSVKVEKKLIHGLKSFFLKNNS
jgi:peptidoglycan/LPS O-acetylase OafA/YrhL